ncbi:glycosyl hydrolase [Halobacillus fulvus]|nr:glycosyl hydrolase [Halobacillus fulvus]
MLMYIQKKGILLLLLMVVISLMFFFSSSQPLKNVNSYKIYYDPPTAAIIEEMQNYDLILIEPVFYSAEDVKKIKKSGTLVYGYINAMEADRWNTDLFDRMEDRDFFEQNGKRIYYEQWDSYLMDMTSDHYRQTLTDEVERQILSKGLDGAFLDTVGNIDNEFLSEPQTWDEQTDGLVKWLSTLKSSFPDLSLIQNWGFTTLEQKTSSYVDGFMWEGFDYSSIVQDDWSLENLQRLKEIRKKHDLQVFTVSTMEERKSAKLASSHRFVHYHNSSTYNDW